MRRILQRKFMLVFWLAMVVNLCSFKMGATITKVDAKVDGGSTAVNNVATVELIYNSETNQTTATVKWRKGFKVESLKISTYNVPVLITGNECVGASDFYCFECPIFNGWISTSSFNANISFADITKAEDLASVFNHYTPNSAVVMNNVITISNDLRGPGNIATNAPGVLKLAGGDIQIEIGGYDITNYILSVDGGNVTINGNESGNYAASLGDISLNAGSLTLNGVFETNTITVADGNLNLNLKTIYSEIQSVQLNGGTLKIDSDTHMIDLVAKSSKIDFSTSTSNTNRQWIDNLTIQGDLEITGKNILSDKAFRGCDLAGQTRIERGTVIMNQVNLSTVEVLDGNITLTNCAFSSFSPSGNFQLSQKGGVLAMSECYVGGDIKIENGKFSIEKGLYSSDIEVTGSNTIAEIKNATLRNSVILQKDGELSISDCIFESPIVIEKGSLNIANTYLYDGNYNGKSACLHILGQTGVKLKDVYLRGSDGCVYVAPGVTLSPEDLLESGYGFYSCDEMVQPDIRLTTEYVQEKKFATNDIYYYIPQIKKISDDPENNCIEAARSASVGEKGRDVVAIPNEDEPGRYNYEVYTEKGLAWVAATFIYNYDDHSEYCDPVPGLKDYPFAYDGTVRLMADLDMSEYDWIPFPFTGNLLDGQGHSIRNLKVKQSNAAFLSLNYGTIANLTIIDSQFESVQTKYTFALTGTYATQSVAGLSLSNTGQIINCGVENSSISCESIDSNVEIGGLAVGLYDDSIVNSYMTGDISCTIKDGEAWEIYLWGDRYIKIGGLVCGNSTTMSNCYFVGKIDHSESIRENVYDIDIKKEDIALGNNLGAIEHCTTSPDLAVLNENVDNHVVAENEIPWCKWTTKENRNNNYPIHDVFSDPSVIESEFTLLKEGNGEFKATYTYLEDETEKTGTIYADTTYTVINQEQFKITATPAEGSELVKVVHIQNGKETELPDIQPGVEFDYNIVVADTLKAYFKEKEIIVIPDELDLSQIQVDTVTVTYENNNWYYQEAGKEKVAFTGDVTGTNKTVVLLAEDIPANAPALQFAEGSSVSSLVVSEESSLQVEGSVTVGSVSGNITAGETTTITPSEEVIPIETPNTVQTGGSYEVTAFGGQVVADKTQLPAGTVLSFEITIQEGYELASATIGGNPLEESLNLLRTRAVSTTRYYKITGNESDLTVDITFRKTDTDEPEDPDTPSVDPVKYYNIYKESICDGVSVSFSKNPVKEGGTISIYVEKDEENYTFENFKVYYKDGYYGNWKELEESTQPGEYKIQNIWNHIYVKAEGSEQKNPTGIEEVEGVKVYTKDGSLFVQTAQREQVIVISMTGAVVKNEEQIGLKQYHGLNPGIYVVRVGEQVFKVRLK